MDKIKTFGDFVAITPFQKGDISTKAGIILPEGSSTNARKALVVDPGCLKEGGLETNDVVLWTGMRVYDVYMNNITVIIVSKNDIMAKIVKDKDEQGD